MKAKILITGAILTTISLSAPVVAENLTQLSKLLSTRQCPACNLTGSGLVMANLSGANLKGADLKHANLSQANLSGADLSGADLTGASLNGANLTDANLSGANMTGTDIRDAYLVNADLTGVNLNTAYVQGAKGLPQYAGDPEQFYRWAVTEAQRGNYKGSIERFNTALSIDHDFAPAYLGRGLSQYRLGNEVEAIKDAQIASQLFEAQKNEAGLEASKSLLQAMELARNIQENPQKDPGPNYGSLFQGIASMVMQFLLR